MTLSDAERALRIESSSPTIMTTDPSAFVDRPQHTARSRPHHRDIVTLDEGAPRRIRAIGQFFREDEQGPEAIANGGVILNQVDVRAPETGQSERVHDVIRSFEGPNGTRDLSNHALFEDFGFRLRDCPLPEG